MHGMADGIKEAFMDSGDALGSIENEECKNRQDFTKLGSNF